MKIGKEFSMKKGHRIMILLLLISLTCGILLTTNLKDLRKIQNLEGQCDQFKVSEAINEVAWNITWGGAGDEHGIGLALDTVGDLYCVGDTFSFGAGGQDLALVKFAPNGSRLWNTTWGGAANDWGYQVAIDTAGDLYCVGGTYSFGAGSSDLALVKFAPNGSRLWNTTWGGAADDSGYEIALDTAGDLYCVGLTYSFGAAGKNLALVKFAPNGSRLWNTTWGGAEQMGFGMALDTADNIYCVGSAAQDLALVKFAPNGSRLWNTTWGGAANDWGYGVVLDTAGNIYCVGWTGSFGVGGQDLALVKFAPNGFRLWNTTWGGAGNDGSSEVVLDTAGNIYIAATTQSFGAGGSDLVLVKFSKAELPSGIPGFGLSLLFLVLIVISIIKIFDKSTIPKKNKFLNLILNQ